MNFLDPVMTTDGKPYGPVRYKEICKEMFIITKQCNIPVEDIKKMTPLERHYFLDFIQEDGERLQEKLQEI